MVMIIFNLLKQKAYYNYNYVIFFKKKSRNFEEKKIDIINFVSNA